MDTSQVIPLYRRPPAELLEEWRQEEGEYAHTVAEFRRRLNRSDPDRRERFRYAIEVGTAHLEALRFRIARAEGLGMESQPAAEPEPARLAWQIGR